MECNDYNEYSVLCFGCEHPSNIKCCKKLERETMFTETLEKKRKKLEELERKHKGLNYKDLWNELKSELIRAKGENEQIGEIETSKTMNATLQWMKYLENKQNMNTK